MQIVQSLQKLHGEQLDERLAKTDERISQEAGEIVLGEREHHRDFGSALRECVP